MMRISFRSLGPRLRPTTSLLQQKSSVCSTCQALANLHRQQLRQRQQNHPQQLAHDSQQRRRLQLYSVKLQRDPVVPSNNHNYGFNFSDSWTYKGNHGVDHWAELFSRNCAGKFQSPVDLSPMNMKNDSKLGDFTFINFDDVTDVVQELWNNGHTAQVSYLSGDLRVNGGGLRSEYRVLQFHFHWGSDNTQGSEHTISGVPYPLEMHVVTYNVHYDNFTNALNYADGLAVLGVFFEVGNFGNYDFDTLTNALPSVKTPGSTILLDPVPLDLLLPVNTKEYYRYQGSLTSPPCSEAVTWTLFRDPVTLSDDQLEAFRGLQALERDEITNAHLPMVDNFRPTQPLHGREIKTSF